MALVDDMAHSLGARVFIAPSRAQVIENAGHLPPLEQPEAVSHALEIFLNGPLVLR